MKVFRGSRVFENTWQQSAPNQMSSFNTSKKLLIKSFPGFRLLGHTSMTNTQKHKTENQQKIF